MFDLFLTFFRIGLFTFGGGYAMISVIDDLCVDKKKWITHDEMMNLTVIAESTPGPIAINCATFVGFRQRGILGSVVATLGMVLPSFIIIYLISMFMDNFLAYTIIANAFHGIKIAVGLLIFDVALNMFLKMKKELLPCLIFGAALTTMLVIDFLSLHFSSIALLLIAAVVSLTIFALTQRGSKR